MRELTEAANGKALTTKQVIDVLNTQAIKIDVGNWTGDPMVYERPEIADVPRDLVNDYAKHLKENGKDVTSEAIQDLHLAVMAERSAF